MLSDKDLTDEERIYLREHLAVNSIDEIEDVEIEVEPEEPIGLPRDYSYDCRDDEFHPEEIQMLKDVRLPIRQTRHKRWTRKGDRRGGLFESDLPTIYTAYMQQRSLGRVAEKLNLPYPLVRTLLQALKRKYKHGPL